MFFYVVDLKFYEIEEKIVQVLFFLCYYLVIIVVYLVFVISDGVVLIQWRFQSLCYMIGLVFGVWSGREGYVDYFFQGELIIVKLLYIVILEFRVI